VDCCRTAKTRECDCSELDQKSSNHGLFSSMNEFAGGRSVIVNLPHYARRLTVTLSCPEPGIRSPRNCFKVS
jgi:hypothetical protein